MGSLADFEFNKAPLCDGMVLISEQVRDDFPSRFVEEELQRLLRLAQEEIAPSWDRERQIERLLELFYDEWGFGASQGVYRLSDALWLDKVLVNRRERGVVRRDPAVDRPAPGAAGGAGDLPDPDAAACGPGNQRRDVAD